jgi:hypothetical protein
MILSSFFREGYRGNEEQQNIMTKENGEESGPSDGSENTPIGDNPFT